MLETFLKRTWAEIDLDIIRNNYNNIRRYVADKSKIMCVVKADAYGLGAVKLSQEFENLGADFLAVSNIEEAIQLREANVKLPILILSYTPVNRVNLLYDYDITQTVVSEDYALRLSEAAESLKDHPGRRGKIKVHIKIDTGMNRIGIQLYSREGINATVNSVKRIFNLDNLFIEGVFTHFASADEMDSGKEFTCLQYQLFSGLICKLKAQNLQIKYFHCCNSGAILNYPNFNLDIVRPGLILYDSTSINNSDLKLASAMQLKTSVSLVKTLLSDGSVSYGRSKFLKAGTKLATVPIGYADGLSRNLSNNFYMLVNGQRAPIVGKICMDQSILDVSNVSGPIKEGDIVTVLGKSGNENINAAKMARYANTIAYEILCSIGKRVPRVYYRNGKVDSISNFLQT